MQLCKCLASYDSSVQIHPNFLELLPNLSSAWLGIFLHRSRIISLGPTFHLSSKLFISALTNDSWTKVKIHIPGKHWLSVACHLKFPSQSKSALFTYLSVTNESVTRDMSWKFSQLECLFHAKNYHFFAHKITKVDRTIFESHK